LFFLQFNILFVLRYMNLPRVILPFPLAKEQKMTAGGLWAALKGQLLLNRRLKRAGPAANEIDAER
jgi:hypothetical protein